jgi:MinD-like ATPase involved in chromosome partitioning or flagellar assembly
MTIIFTQREMQKAWRNHFFAYKTATSMNRFLTWLDVRRRILQETRRDRELKNKGIVRVNCFSDAVEIGITGDKESAKSIVKQWFGDWYLEEESVIQLDMGDDKLPVEFTGPEEIEINPIEPRPFWEEIAYLPEIETSQKSAINLPDPYTQTKINKTELLAFYSFKGGVGRTLNLVAYLLALLERSKELNQPINILVIDADLEAPGLTYWNGVKNPAACFLDFLEVYHYSRLPVEHTLSLFAKELKKNLGSHINEDRSKVYFLPACLNDQQLLDRPILPEHLVRSAHGAWGYSNAINLLGQELDINYVFIDLRAGLSEISSPIIFDPRVERFIVTTISEQSIRGTNLVLQQIGKVAPSQSDIEHEKYYDPWLLINMLKQEVIDSPRYKNAVDEFYQNYIQPEDTEDVYSKRLEIIDAFFAEELLYINSWEEARSRLSATTLMKNARKWAETKLITADANNQEVLSEDLFNKKLDELKKIRDLCEKYRYAETGKGENLLIIEPLRNLASDFSDKLPNVLCIGAKGSGKTFNYMHLSRLRNWESFLRRVDGIDGSQNHEKPKNRTYIFPLLQSQYVECDAQNIINEARNEVRSALKSTLEFSHSNYTDEIKSSLKKSLEENWNELKWTEFWISKIIAKSIDINFDIGHNTLMAMDRELKERKLNIIFLFDGLENVFPEIYTDTQQRIALKALIDDVPTKISEIRKANIGVIIFLHRDFLKHTITQNLAQFENRYSSYNLFWDRDLFLRLVYWICSESGVINADKNRIDDLSTEDLRRELQKLWGQKLGSDKSKEANTASWIFAALTDFKGNLQARDIIRFLYFATSRTLDTSKETSTKWFSTRLLPPQAIRQALQPCSREKVKEVKEEYPLFKTWVEETLPSLPEKKIPFDVNHLKADQDTIRVLEEIGVIYEDKDKDEATRFYIPEIFRAGLGFSGTTGRPRTLALKQKIFGKAN